MLFVVSEKSKKQEVHEEEVEQIAKQIQAGSVDFKNDPVLRENLKVENVSIVTYKVHFDEILNEVIWKLKYKFMQKKTWITKLSKMKLEIWNFNKDQTGNIDLGKMRFKIRSLAKKLKMLN